VSSRPTHRRLSRLVWLCALSFVSMRAVAQTEPEARHVAPLKESLWGDARVAYEAANTLVEANDFAGALAKYKQAYDASHDPRLLFDMAVCERDLHRYARMQELLQRYMREAGDALQKQDRADIDAALLAIRPLVGTVKLAVSEAGAHVAVDGESIGVTPLAGPFTVDAGSHSLRIQKPGFETVEQNIQVSGGNEATVAITFVALVPAGRLVVSSDSAATVLIDAKPMARARFDGRVTSGLHTVRVTEPGKVPYETQVEVADGAVRTMQVTLVDGPRPLVWPWVVGGTALVVGGVVGGYFLFKSREETQGPTGTLGTVTVPSP
jgi:PEGA domain